MTSNDSLLVVLYEFLWGERGGGGGGGGGSHRNET